MTESFKCESCGSAVPLGGHEDWCSARVRIVSIDDRLAEAQQQIDAMAAPNYEPPGLSALADVVEHARNSRRDTNAPESTSAAVSAALESEGMTDPREPVVTRERVPAETLGNIAGAIADFDAECSAAEYTDTGEAWELLHWIKRIAEGGTS